MKTYEWKSVDRELRITFNNHRGVLSYKGPCDTSFIMKELNLLDFYDFIVAAMADCIVEIESPIGITRRKIHAELAAPIYQSLLKFKDTVSNEGWI